MTRVTRTMIAVAFSCATRPVRAAVAVPAAVHSSTGLSASAAAPTALPAASAASATPSAPAGEVILPGGEKPRVIPIEPSASGAPEPLQAAPVLVTASRPLSTLDQLPAAVTVIRGDRLAVTGGATAGETVADAGLAGRLTYPSAALADATIRGFSLSFGDVERSQVAVLVDGLPAGTANLAKLPVDGLEQLELVRGAGSALFGSSAMGGAINLVPRRGRGAPAGLLGLEAGTFGLRRVRAEYGGETGPVDFFASGVRLTQGDYRSPGVPQPVKAGRDEWSGAATIGSTLEGHRVAVSGFGYFGDRLESPGSSSFPEDPRDFDRKRYGTGRATYDGVRGEWSTRQAVYVSRDEDFYHAYYGPTESVTRLATDQRGGLHALTWEHPRWLAVTAGIEWWDRRAESDGFGSPPFQPLSRTRDLAGVVETRVSAPAAPLVLSAGVRRDALDQSVAQPSRGEPIPGLTGGRRTWGETTGRVGATAKLGAARLHASTGTGFRAPVAYELAANYADPFGTNYHGNPGLKPERSVMTEGGMEGTVGPVRGGLTYFDSVLEDRIQRVSTGVMDRSWTNVEGVSVAGVEFDVSAGLASAGAIVVRPFASGTYHTSLRVADAAEIARIGGRLPLNVPRWFGTAGVEAARASDRPGGWSARVAVRSQGGERQEDFRPPLFGGVFPKLRAVDVWTVEARYTVSASVRVFARADNVLDSSYQEILDYPQPGASAVAGASLAF